MKGVHLGDGELGSFLGAPDLSVQDLFEEERFPNVVVAPDGTVVATWGAKHLVARRSEDGGSTWDRQTSVGEGIHAGGTTVDETTGEILFWGHPEHPPKGGVAAPRTLYVSPDTGRTWQERTADYALDRDGYLPALHFAEHGISLRAAPHAGRLLRPARVYSIRNGYNLAIYSDDRGQTWHVSDPLPVDGTGEGCVVELSDGRILYSSRQHHFADDASMRWERLYAISHDGGVSWREVAHSVALPDGPRYRGDEGRGANFNGHFGMAAGLVRLPIRERDVLVYSNADEVGHERVRMTAWASFDGGHSWPVKRLVDGGPSAYSSLDAGRSGTPSEGWMYLQYEVRSGGGRLARFNLSWLTKGEETGDGSIPDWALV